MKSSMKKFIISLAIIMAASFLIAFTVLYATGGVKVVNVSSSQIKTQEYFNAVDVNSIVIDVVDTDVNIIPATGNEIGIDFYGNVTSNLSAGKPELVTELKNGVLSINIEYPKTITIGLVNLSHLYLDVYVPEDFSTDMKVTTVSGNLGIEKFNIEDFYFKSISGHIKADSLSTRSLKLQTTSGKVNLSDVEGDIDINTVSGGVTAGLKSFNDNLKVKTISGEVNLSLPDDSEFGFKLGSVSGRIVNEFSSKITFADGSKLEGSVGKDSFNIDVNTVSGSIKIIKE